MDRLRDLPGWPHAAQSRFVRCAPHDWHLQEMGRGPLVLLLHGAGASTHSWRDLMPALARHCRVLAIDLPGQGFSRLGSPARAGLQAMTEDLAALCAQNDWQPRALIGHSAGAALALALAPRLRSRPAVVGLNAALGHFDGPAAWLFPLLARLLSVNPLTARLFTLGGPNPERARRLIAGTGSEIDETGLRCYARLMADRAHVDATLQMMSRWRIDPLLAQLPRIETPVLLVASAGDRAVPPAVSERAAARLPQARLQRLDRLGHLCHEEAPERLAQEIIGFLRARGIGAEPPAPPPSP
jgi:magnesium chelatase accessory protein